MLKTFSQITDQFHIYPPSLSYFLLNIYINDIVRASNIFDFIIYADDTTLSATLEIILRNTQTLDTESKLSNELANICNWLKLNKLSLNVQKSKYIIFRTPKKHVNALYLVHRWCCH